MMVTVRFIILATGFLAVSALQAQTPAPSVDWTTAKELPAVDFSGLSAQQKTDALKSLRTEACACGCNMRVAQCRVLDPGCGDSKTLAGMIVERVKGGKTADQIHEALINSPIVKARAAQNNILADPVTISTAGSPSRGPDKARITMVEFSDFQCPYCSAAVGKVNAILRAYPNDVKLVFKQFPLETHSRAMPAAEAALAAHAQGKFWELHDKMFANVRMLTGENILVWAKEIGLDMDKFRADLQSHKFRPAVDRDVEDGMKAFVQGTPTFYINGQRYNGHVELEALRPILDAELKKAP
jgi:protein-disulfide isomerase